MNFFKKTEDNQLELLHGELRRRISDAGMPGPVQKIAEQELDILSKINPSTAEYTIGITYIDYLLSSPGTKRPRTCSISPARNGS